MTSVVNQRPASRTRSFVLGAAAAAPIGGLFNTGLDAGGAVLPNGGLDAHYTVPGSPNAPAVGFTHPACAADVPIRAGCRAMPMAATAPVPPSSPTG